MAFFKYQNVAIEVIASIINIDMTRTALSQEIDSFVSQLTCKLSI